MLFDALHLLCRLLRGPQALGIRIEDLIKRRGIGSYSQRYGIGAVERPHYAHMMYSAASLAAKLGHKRVSVIEYGVAGGNGLIAMERHAVEIEKLLPIEFEIYGFDTGKGLPPPMDYRDLPYFFQAGTYPMDQEKLAKRLRRARLVIGDVRETAKTFFTDYAPAPIGALAYDLDYYSSTVDALQMLTAGERHFLPRLFCYFDDTLGEVTELYNDFTGERLAIQEFNDRNEHIKLAVPYYLLALPQDPWRQQWHRQIWIAHFFQHSQYNTFVSIPDQRLDLA